MLTYHCIIGLPWHHTQCGYNHTHFNPACHVLAYLRGTAQQTICYQRTPISSLALCHQCIPLPLIHADAQLGSARLDINGKLSSSFKVSQGFCQGDPLSGPPIHCSNGTPPPGPNMDDWPNLCRWPTNPPLLDLLCRRPNHHPCQPCLLRQNTPPSRQLQVCHRD